MNAKISRLIEQADYHFVTTSRKCVLPEDGWGAEPSYHVCSNDSMHQDDTRRLHTLAELEEFLKTAIAANNAPTFEEASEIWMQYQISRY